MFLLFYLSLGMIVSRPMKTWAYCEDKFGIHCNYSNKGLSRIPNNISTTTTSLDLNHNVIEAFLDYALKSLSKLRRLNLGYNKISKLENRSLYGLESLCYLDLQFNELSMTYESFPLPVFMPVSNLQELVLENNNYNQQSAYPDETFKQLKNLRRLAVDVFSDLKLGPGFKELTKLNEFYSSNGELGVIKNSSFVSFTSTGLEILILKDCGIVAIEVGSFQPLKSLQTLDLSANRGLGLSNGLLSLYGLQYRNVSNIILNKINPSEPSLNSTIVDVAKTRFLANICVANLDLGHNYIVQIDLEIFQKFQFPNCLINFSIRRHLLMNGFLPAYIYSWVRFKNLRYLDISGQKQLARVASAEDIHAIAEIQIPFPPSLRLLNISHLFNSIRMKTQVKILGAEKFEVLDVSSNNLYYCLFPFAGLENMTVLNISDSDCSRLSPHILDNFPNLKVLVAQRIHLNAGLENDPNGKVLYHQSKLTSLNMVDNGLTDLHPELFTNLRLVQSLNLANNKFLAIPSTVRSLVSLRRLDMSYNAMTNLDAADRKWLDGMSVNIEGGFHLSLQANPLSCTCSTLQFIQWLLETHVHVDRIDRLGCILENGTKTLIVDLKHDLRNFRVRCVSKFWLVFSVSTASVVAVSLFLGVIGYRFRWNIKYWFLTKCRGGSQYEPLPPDTFRFDAFVAYNHEDYNWACVTLREFLEDGSGYHLCLHHRDFPVGESIQGNIVDAINTSRKIILVISRRYIGCDWAEFEMRMASMRMVQSGRDNMVIAILLEDIPVREMPRTLIDIWRSITFLRWTNDPGDENIFWGRLEEAMSRP